MVCDDFEINFWVCSHPVSLLNEIIEGDEVCNCFSCKYCNLNHLNLMMILEEEKKSLNKRTIMFLAVGFALQI